MRWLAVLALVACEKSKPDCKVEADELGTFLAAMPHEGAMFQAQKDLELVARPELPVTKRDFAPVVIMTASVMTYQGQLIANADELYERLVASNRLLAERTRDGDKADPTRLYLQIDRTVTWKRVVEAVDTADKAGFTSPGFVFAGTKPTRPPRTAIDDELDALEKAGPAAKNLQRLSELVRSTIEPCPPLAVAFQHLASSTDRPDLFAPITAAVVECNCKPDVATVRSLLWRIFYTDPTPILAFDSTTRDKTLALPAATTWAEASKQIPAGVTGMRLIVK